LRVVVFLLLACLLPVPSSAQAAPAELVERARGAIAPALLVPAVHGEPALVERLIAQTSALGCPLLAGVALPDPVEVLRIEFPLAAGELAVHVSADGSYRQVCDARQPRLGSGVQFVARAAVDSDGDGLPDRRDPCPMISASAGGCPLATAADRDGDGLRDSQDHCPEQAGAAFAGGCALMRDGDGDSIPDELDLCPGDYGSYRAGFARGCPLDGSGTSTKRRAAKEHCRIGNGGISRLESPGLAGGRSSPLPADAVVQGRSTSGDWLQVEGGWVRAAEAQLQGACYNLPRVSDIKVATGCAARTRGDSAVYVRQAPVSFIVAQMQPHEHHVVQGRDWSGEWLFTRLGWTSRSVLELQGSCEGLPILDPALAASGSLHFCPPDFSGYLRPRIRIGPAQARVASTSIANRLRAAPDVHGQEIGDIAPRRRIDAVLDGPACRAPHVWWQVEVDGQVGWTAESDLRANVYYLEPAAADAPAGDTLRGLAQQPQAPTSLPLHSAALERVELVATLPIAAKALAWSRQGEILALLSTEGKLALFDGGDHRQLSAPPTDGLNALAFSRQGHWLALGDARGVVSLLELRDSPSMQILGGLAEAVQALAWSPQGQDIAAVAGTGLSVWHREPEAQQGAVQWSADFPYTLQSLAYSADGRWLAVTGSAPYRQRAALWVLDSQDGALAHSQALLPSGGALPLQASPDLLLGDFVYASGDSLYQLDMGSGESTRLLHEAGAQLLALALRGWVIADADALLALSYRADGGEPRLLLANALNPFGRDARWAVSARQLAFRPDGRALALLAAAGESVLILGATA